MRNRIFYLLTAVVFFVVLLSGCKKEEEKLPVVVTSEISSITDTTAMGGGIVKSDGGAEVTDRGLLWSFEDILFLGWSAQSHDGTGTGTFSSKMEYLYPGTIYNVQAYATNRVGTAYGEKITFTTLP